MEQAAGAEPGGQAPLFMVFYGLRDYIRENVVGEVLAEIDQLVAQMLLESGRRGALLNFMS